MKCSACPNPAFDQHPKAPLCLPCLEAWRDLEDSPRITEPYAIELSDLDRQFNVHIVFAELDRELRKRDPRLAEKIRSALVSGDSGLEQLRHSLTHEEALCGFGVMVTVVTRVWGPPGVPV